MPPGKYKIKSLSYIGTLWFLIWFWLSANPSIPAFFPENLYLVSAANALTSVFLGLLFLSVWLSKPVVRPVSLVAKWMFLYIGWVTFASFFFSPYVWDNWFKTAGLLASSASLLTSMLLGSRLLDSRYALIVAGRAYVLGTLTTTAGLLLTGVDSLRFGNEELLHPNSLGFLYGSSLCFLLTLPLYHIQLIRSALIVIFAILLVLSFSKTSIIGTLLAWLASAIFQRGLRRVGYLVSLLIVGSVVFLSLQSYVQQQVEAYVSQVGFIETLTGRTNLWSWTLEMVKDRLWVGYGFGTFREVFAPYSLDLGFVVPIVHAHNAWLDALFAGGVVGMAIFSASMLLAAGTIFRVARRLAGAGPSLFLVTIATFVLVRGLTEGALNLGRDFIVLSAAAFVAERWLYRSSPTFDRQTAKRGM